MACKRRSHGLRSHLRAQSERPTDTDTDRDACRKEVDGIEDPDVDSRNTTFLKTTTLNFADSGDDPISEEEVEFQTCRDDNERDIPHRRASDITAANVNPSPVVVRQRLISPSLQRSTHGKGDQGASSHNMTSTVYGAVKGALQDMSQTLVTIITQAFKNGTTGLRENTNINHHPNYRGSQNNTTFRTKEPLHSRPKKRSRLSNPKRREDSDDSTSDDSA